MTNKFDTIMSARQITSSLSIFIKIGQCLHFRNMAAILKMAGWK